MRRIAIIGAGHAGVQVAVSLRMEGYDGEIVLFGSEAELPYQRPPLSKDYLFSGEPALKRLRPSVFYAENRVELALGSTVSRIDASGSLELGTRGNKLSFDAIVLAVGAGARRLHLSDDHLEGIHVLRCAADAERLRASLADDGPVVIVGAGLIGMELAAGLSACGREVTILERGERMLARIVPPEASELMGSMHRAWGSRLKFNCSVRAFLGRGRVQAVELEDGEILPARTVVVSTGSEPHVELARSASLACDDGVLVDKAMRTSSPKILAVGDCASAFRHELGRTARLESVQSANEQARTAALSLLGKPPQTPAIPWFWSEQRDAKLQIAGIPSPDAKSVLLPGSTNNRFTLLGLIGDRISHVVTLNSPADHVAARKAIAENWRLTQEEAMDLGGDFHAWCRAQRPGSIVATR